MVNRKTEISIMNSLNDADVTTWHLPKGAIGRLARGRVTNMSFSHDGEYLAVATTIGCWLYDRASLKPIALFDQENGMVSSVIFSHDNQFIATSNSDGVVKIWETQSLECLAKIDHRKNVEATSGRFDKLHFSHDNKYLAASSIDMPNVVYAWQQNTDEPFTYFPIDIDIEDMRGHIFPICFSPKENLLAYVSAGTPDYTLTISDIETGEHIARLNCLAPLTYQGLVFSPCGQYLATVNLDKHVFVWDVYKGTLETEPITYHPDARLIPTYTPDDTLRIAEIRNNKVVIWDANQNEKNDTLSRQKRRTDHFLSGHQEHFSSNGAYIATIQSRSDLCVWTIGTPSRKITSPADHKPVPHSVTFSPEGKTVASGHGFGMYQVIWNVAKRQKEQIFPTQKIQAQRLTLTQNLTEEERQQWYRISVLSPCGERLALRDLPRGSVEIWDITSETLITELCDSKGFGREIRFSPTGENFIGAAPKGDIGVWDTESGEKIRTLPGDNRMILTAAFHPNGRQLAAAPKGSAGKLWDIDNGEQIGVFPTELPEDTSLYRGNPEQIHQYIQTYKKRKGSSRYKCIPYKLAFSPCGTIIACGIQDKIQLRDAATFETCMLILLPETCRRPFALTFSPCGKYLVSGSWWRKGLEKVSIRIWEVATGKNIHTFWGHTTDVQDLAFTPDGKLLASCSYDGTILLWDMKPYV